MRFVFCYYSVIVYVGVLQDMDTSEDVFSGISVSEVSDFNIKILVIVLCFQVRSLFDSPPAEDGDVVIEDEVYVVNQICGKFH